MSEIKTNKISSLTSSNSDITLDPDGTGDTIIASGSVGIGTNSPSGELHVKASSGFSELYVQGSSSTSGMYLFDQGSEAGLWKVDSGYLAFATNNTERMRVTSAGDTRIGQSSTSTPGQGNTTEGLSLTGSGRVFISSNGSNYGLGLNRNGDGELTNFSRSGDFKGSITINSSSVSYNTTSDHRLKQNVVDMTGAIDRVKALAPKRFDFISDAGNTVDGFLAHEAQAVVPEAVTGTHNEVDDDGNPKYQQIDQAKLVPLLTGALREAITKIEALETSNADLIARIETLENA